MPRALCDDGRWSEDLHRGFWWDRVGVGWGCAARPDGFNNALMYMFASRQWVTLLNVSELIASNA
jgi:hypothetical protein